MKLLDDTENPSWENPPVIFSIFFYIGITITISIAANSLTILFFFY